MPSVQIQLGTFKRVVWPLLSTELSLSWEEHNFNTLNVLLAAKERFPKVIKESFLQEHLECQALSDARCFTKLAAFLLVKFERLITCSRHHQQYLCILFFK